MTSGINQNIGRIFYLIPDIHRSDYSLRKLWRAARRGKARAHIRTHWRRQPKPVGGIKVMYQHCMLLQELGYDAWPLRMGRYEGNFFDYPIQCRTIADTGYQLQANDIVVCPEITPYLGLQFGKARAVMFAQNWTHMYGKLNPNDQQRGYLELGYDRIMVCGRYLQTTLLRDPPGSVALVNNFIDLDKFRAAPERRVTNRILALPRKNPDDLKAIQHLLQDRQPDFRLIDGVPESRMIDEYQQADIFLATGYPEGFGLPPLEAMACGAAVVGFTGGGASEFMHDASTALVADDGDVETAARKLAQLLDDRNLRETLRGQGHAIAQTYGRDRTKRQLAEFYANLMT